MFDAFLFFTSGNDFVIYFFQQPGNRSKYLWFNFFQVVCNGIMALRIINRNTKVEIVISKHSFINVIERKEAQRFGCTVNRRKIPAGIYIAEKIFMRKHYSFGVTCGAGSVNKCGKIIFMDAGFYCFYFIFSG